MEKYFYMKRNKLRKGCIFGQTKSMNKTKKEISDAEAFEIASVYRRYDDVLRRFHQESPPIAADAKNIVWEALMNEGRKKIIHEMKKNAVFTPFPFHLLNSIILLTLAHFRPAQDFESVFGRPPYTDGELAESNIGGEFLDAHDL